MPLLGTRANAGASGYGITLSSAAVPGAPTIGTATTTGTTTATVSYTAPTNTGSSPITSYTAVSSPGGVTGTLSQAGSGTITVSGLTSGTDYTFTVFATNAAGNSPSSAASNSIRTNGVPSAPGIGTATANSSNTANLTFTAPSNNGGSAILAYEVESTPAGAYIDPTPTTAGTYLVQGLSPTTSYRFRVRAYNSFGAGDWSSLSNSTTTLQRVPLTVTPTTINTGALTAGTWAYANITIQGTGGQTSYITVQETSRPSSWSCDVEGGVSPNATYSTFINNGTTIVLQIGVRNSASVLTGSATFAVVNTGASNIVVTMIVP